MAWLAEALKVVPAPEQRLIAPMRLNVVNNLRINSAESAAGMQTQELGPQLFPFARIAALAAVRAVLVVATFPLALADDLTDAERVSRDNGTA